MAKTVVTTDDVDGSAHAETVEFSFDGTSYTIDLAKKNRAAFEKALKPWIDAAQKTSSGRGRGRRAATAPASRGRGRRSRPASVDLAAVRAWAADNDHEVAARGRIAQSVIDAYNVAHQLS
jgi:hypothetical protein